MLRSTGLLLLLAASVASSGCAPTASAEGLNPAADPEREFDDLLARQADLTYRQLFDATPARDYLEKLSFDPTEAKFYDETVERLQLTSAEIELLDKNGFVSVDHDQRYSFGALYHAVYTHDLPVLITSDSILHAMHRTYDDLLKELESGYFSLALQDVLTACHDRLPTLAESDGGPGDVHRDVDLYLTVARNLLKGAGAPAAVRTMEHAEGWDGSLLVSSKFDQDRDALELLEQIQFGALERGGAKTGIYGGSRPIDYSQFKPRGHYTHNPQLSRFFRAMMWLGRADSGWYVLPPDPTSGIVCDSRRELRDAVLLTRLLMSTGTIDTLQQVSALIDYMVGRSDSLSVFQMRELLERNQLTESGLLDNGEIALLEEALQASGLGAQRIRSQIVTSNEHSLHQVEPPAAFQLFGQRFVLDSFVLSKVVYDSILFDGRKVPRHMPAGLDVMYALGNDAALPLLEVGMTRFPYAANLKASRDFVEQTSASAWRETAYNTWLSALRTLDEDLSGERHAPQVMRTAAWQRKQLQTQLASWSELRHNTVLYAKQPYTSGATCVYPYGYVEPYPELYAQVKVFTNETARQIEAAGFFLAGRDLSSHKQRTAEALRNMSEILDRLETLARKELAAEPFSQDDVEWIKGFIVKKGRLGCAGPPYDGWYTSLFYRGPDRCAEWSPTIVDVHTNPNGEVAETLEAGVGDCNFLVAAIDNDGDRMVYVGPVYSYYEFLQPAEDRLTDEAWGKLLEAGEAPPRPAWIDLFQAPKLKREAQKR
jgi:hypothetical protein